ncbi:glucan biosynthesis protein [Oceanicola sp. 22II-s10i]|uniref:glucan biosynthesis protein n=1 Tax=Oceanicola sp. 22II-s10i TaxID=1317116 RepID=UPI0034E8A6E9
MCATLPRRARAQDGEPFSFDALTERMRLESLSDPLSAPTVDGFLTELDYDDYQRIRFRQDHARWSGDGSRFRVNAFHPGWLFRELVAVHEVVDGVARPMRFSTGDFEYFDPKTGVPEAFDLPGVAGVRLLNPLNRADKFDELLSFLGASYFRALGQDTLYGLSARGLAVNTGHSDGEEFPRFSAFWLERPAPGAQRVTIYAALNSASVTGAYRFVVTPGTDTVMEVTARLFLRRDVAQLGIAPLTSMFLFGGGDRMGFDDYRPAVHDSEALVVNLASGETLYRPLKNPARLAGSYLGMENPVSFGLVQRTRDFDEYLDAQAHYERRPSLMVEPIGDWGKGTVRLIEIPSELEGNDNIAAFWTPEAPATAGSQVEVAYRLHWGREPAGDGSSLRARILRTRAGKGGVSGVDGDSGRRKFVIDFKGGLLRELPADAEVTPVVSATRGRVSETVLSRIDGSDVWRLVIEVEAEARAAVELRAHLAGFGDVLSETWLYQWVKE